MVMNKQRRIYIHLNGGVCGLLLISNRRLGLFKGPSRNEAIGKWTELLSCKVRHTQN